MGMNKRKWIAVIICALISFGMWVGSTGLFYTTYRPIRNYDLVGYAGSWIGLLYYLWRDRNQKDD
jgi:uncharacterized membrane protein YdcZ (DUF606 family)